MDTLKRSRTPAPTEAGWYYARSPGEAAPGQSFPIEPTEVSNAPWSMGKVDLGVWSEHEDKHWPLDSFEWFGPVPAVIPI